MIGMTGIDALETEMRDRLKAKDDEVERLRSQIDALHENNVLALRERDEARSQQSWQPIETAPKDGSNILICGFSGSGYYVTDVKWSEDEGEFCLFHPDEDIHNVPTYLAKFWMPLPAPPSNTSAQGKSE